MPLLSLFLNYLYWHYTRGVIELGKNLADLLRFEWHFFSTGRLLRTWFSPWRRLGEDYGRRFSFEVFATAFVVNTLMRLVGFFIRTWVILFGLITLTVSVPVYALVMIAWFVLPLLIPVLIFFGLYLLFFASPK